MFRNFIITSWLYYLLYYYYNKLIKLILFRQVFGEEIFHI